MAVTAGEQLRADLTDALARASRNAGAPLSWDEREQRAVDAAVRAADHIELLERVIAGEAAAEQPNASAVTKAAAEIRQQDRHLAECLARLDLGHAWAAEAGKSQRHVDMARQRWGAQRPTRRVK